jgi:hypothetical protein
LDTTADDQRLHVEGDEPMKVLLGWDWVGGRERGGATLLLLLPDWRKWR